MPLVEVLEGRWQLPQHGLCVTQVHAGHVVALEGVDEALGHAVALRAADGCVDGLEAHRTGQCPCVGSDIRCAVVAQKLQHVARRDRIHTPEAPLHGLDERLAHRLRNIRYRFEGAAHTPRPELSWPRAIADSLTVT